MGAGPGVLPSAFICAICGSFPAGRAGGGSGAFKVQRFNGSRFNGCDRVQLCCLCYLLLVQLNHGFQSFEPSKSQSLVCICMALMPLESKLLLVWRFWPRSRFGVALQDSSGSRLHPVG